ncbi:MAG: DNA-3-methyladenine glycosylase [Oscillospiraceae bacterium]|jgi:DNA-3-methyladenine glycosylase|nr:DNA-3-methyladenine glycosylase [Oscillospiraceae bacterium]
MKKLAAKRLNNDFYALPATEVATLLLGKLLCVSCDSGVSRYAITETECYYGFSDTASHACRHKTTRNAVMFSEGGHLYVYLCYGVYDMLNVVTGPSEHPEAVLIRGGLFLGDSEQILLDGPGKLTRHGEITRQDGGLDCRISDRIWFEDAGLEPEYEALPRIGIGYASKADKKRLWRFRVKNTKDVALDLTV